MRCERAKDIPKVINLIQILQKLELSKGRGAYTKGHMVWEGGGAYNDESKMWWNK